VKSGRGGRGGRVRRKRRERMERPKERERWSRGTIRQQDIGINIPRGRQP
jgi:hypothetical protein